MFRRFWPTKWVYGNRRHWCSFKDTTNWLVWNDVKLIGLQNCYLGVSKFWKFRKKCPFFSFQDIFPPNQNFQKTVTYVRRQCLMKMCTKCQVDIFKKWLRCNHRWRIVWKCGCRSTHFTVVHPQKLMEHPWRTSDTVLVVHHGCSIHFCGCMTAKWVLRHPHFHTILHLWI